MSSVTNSTQSASKKVIQIDEQQIRSHVEEVGFSKRFGLSMFFKKMLELCVCYWYLLGLWNFPKDRYFEGK